MKKSISSLFNKNSPTMKEKEQTNGPNQNSKLDAIKDLIFGDNMIQYDSTFNEIKKDIDTKNKFLKGHIADVKKDLEQHINSINADISAKLTDLENKIENKASALEAKKVDKKQLSKLLIALGEKIGN